MRKAMILTLILACLLSIGGVALAANFTDVPAKHWAYDAVGQLYKAGLIDGYGDGTFRGDKPLTRYEFAFVTARALENYHKANVEQRALLDKLSVEFATELNNIGVRLTKLEKNQPNIKFTGSLRVRYNITDYTAPSTKTSDVYGQYNLRLEAAAKVDDNTTFNARFMSKVPDKKILILISGKNLAKPVKVRKPVPARMAMLLLTAPIFKLKLAQSMRLSAASR